MLEFIKLHKIKQVPAGITAPKGFTANAVNSGLRKKKLDFGVFFSEKSCNCSGCFTKNIVKAAPVLFSSLNIKNKIHAVVINSGIANACTGKRGYADTKKTAEVTAKLLNLKSKNILVFSTGVIGKFLDMKKIIPGLEKVIPLLKQEGHKNISEAILTTDTVKKEIAVEFFIKGKKMRIGAMAKGSGMIAPNIATMLVFITSDINIEKKLLNEIFTELADKSFNKITIDGDMSTNDSAVILCNGTAGNRLLTGKDKKEIRIFYNNLYYVMDELAKQLVADGEGVTKFIQINVINAGTVKDARKIGFKIANSPLVKTAFYGSDANWGRVLASAGASGVNFNPDKVEIKFGRYVLYRNGMPVKFNEKRLKKYLDKREIEVFFNVGSGKESFLVYTSDLTEEYIKINAHYRS